MGVAPRQGGAEGQCLGTGVWGTLRGSPLGPETGARPHRGVGVAFLFKYLNCAPHATQSLMRARLKATCSLRTGLLALILIITFIVAINTLTTPKLHSGGSRAPRLQNEKRARQGRRQLRQSFSGRSC